MASSLFGPSFDSGRQTGQHPIDGANRMSFGCCRRYIDVDEDSGAVRRGSNAFATPCPASRA